MHRHLYVYIVQQSEQLLYLLIALATFLTMPMYTYICQLRPTSTEQQQSKCMKNTCLI